MNITVNSASALSLMTAKMTLESADAIKEGHVESAALVVKALISSGMAISNCRDKQACKRI